MFDELSAKLTAALQKLTGRGVLTEEAVKDGLREIRRVLLEADVSFDLTRQFLERVEQKAVGVELLKTVRPGELLVKFVPGAPDGAKDNARQAVGARVLKNFRRIGVEHWRLGRGVSVEHALEILSQ